MKRNIGILDRVARVVLVAVVAVLFFTNQLPLVAAIILGALSLVLLVTSIIGVCPLYMLFGISTKRKTAA
jgi:hypothetical protein